MPDLILNEMTLVFGRPPFVRVVVEFRGLGGYIRHEVLDPEEANVAFDVYAWICSEFYRMEVNEHRNLQAFRNHILNQTQELQFC